MGRCPLHPLSASESACSKVRNTYPGERTHGVRIMYADEVHQLTATEILAERLTVLSILRKQEAINMVGADAVEVSPPFNVSGIAAVAGAQIAMELICLRAKKCGECPVSMPA